jgi:transposase
MAHRHSDEFKRDAARIALTSGLTRRQVPADLGIGLSTLNEWVKAFSEESALAGPDQNLVWENDRRQREERPPLSGGETAPVRHDGLLRICEILFA